MQKRRNAERLARVILIVGILSLLGALFLLFTDQRSSSAEAQAAKIVQPPLTDRPSVQGNAMGDPDAPVKIVEFSDFLCPYCRQFFLQTEQPLIEDYVTAGKVYFVYRTLGDWLGPASQASAEAAYCAGDQGRFWEYHDLLFANQGSGAFLRDRLRAFAQALDLDEEGFNACLSSAKYRDQVLPDLADGLQAGVRGTPSFLINGELVAGAQSYAMFRQEIEAALAEAGD
jgi:protein-disulfide isomerase